jgi:UTP--glucose-1-phosphate uridylyltransferase
MKSLIRKVVFPVAGLGTRFLPATKVMAKEMLPVVDKPLIQWASEEAISAGADTLVFVINRNKRMIADHFDTAFELEHKLERSGKTELLQAARGTLPSGIEAIYVVQQEALGLGHAVLCAKAVVGDEPFGVILPDDFIFNGSSGVLRQLADQHALRGGSVVAVEPVDPAHTSRYGIVDVAGVKTDLAKIIGIVEKPKPENAPSNLAVVGRYILDGRIFALLEQTKPGAGGEIQLTDGIAALMREQDVFAYRFEGERFDCGSKAGFIEANLAMALRDTSIAAEVADVVRRAAAKLAPN